MKNRKLMVVFVFSLLIVLPYISAVTSVTYGTTIVEEWTMFHGNPSHSGFAVSTIPTSSFALLWNYSTGAAVVSSPAIAQGYVVVGSDDNSIYCINATNGKLAWTFPTGNKVESSPAIDGDRVYVTSEDGYLYCLNITTGFPYWVKWIGGYAQSSPTVSDGRVFVGSGKSGFYSFNASDGNLLWEYPTKEIVDSSPAISDGVVFFATNDFFVYALNVTTGMEIWNVHTGSTFSSPTLSDGFIYIGSNDGYVCALNASTGAKIWQYQTADEIASSPAATNGYVYVGSEDNNIYCLNASNGQKIWQTPTGYWVWSSPAVANNAVFVGSEDYDLYCVNASNGTKLWTYQTGGFVDSSPAITNGNIYVGSDDHRIYAFALNNATTSALRPQLANSFPFTTTLFDATLSTIGAFVIFFLVRLVKERRKSQVAVPNDKEKSWFSTHLDSLFVAAILAFSILFFVNLGRAPLLVADEQTYSQWAFHMVKSGDYLMPWAFGGQALWIGKPPLNMWLMSLSYQVLGINNFSSRLPSVVFGSLSLILVFYFGKKLYNSYVGFFSALILGTLTTFFELARQAMTDVPFVFFFVASIYFYVSSEKSEKTKTINWNAILSGIFFGLALMTKQIQALLIPLIILTYIIITKRSLRFLFEKNFTLLWGIGLLIFSPWLIYMTLSYGLNFLQWFFIYSEFSRTVIPLEGHGGSIFYYFSSFAANENPIYVLLLPLAVGLCAFNSLVKRLKQDFLILVWIFMVIVVFTFAQTKLDYYILPAYPAFAIAIGSFLFNLFRKIKQVLF